MEYDMELELDKNGAGELFIDQRDEPSGLLGSRIILLNQKQLQQIIDYARQELQWEVK